MNWENVLGTEHCRHDGQVVLKIDFRFLHDQGPRCDRFAQLALSTFDGWTILKEVQYNDYDRMWIPNKEHAILALKAYAAYLFAPDEYPAAYLAFQSACYKEGRAVHQMFCGLDAANPWLPDPDMTGAKFRAAIVELRTAENLIQLIGPRGASTIGTEVFKAWTKSQSWFLAVLLDLPEDTPRDEVWKAYRQARAHKLGLPLDISEEELLRAEFQNPEKRLTIKQLLDRYHDLLRLRFRNERK